MDQTLQYTRCPHCKTAFKVTAAMLQAAKGKVRCGACLAVFQATDYLLQPKVDKTPPAQPAEQILSNQPAIARQEIASNSAGSNQTESGQAESGQAESDQAVIAGTEPLDEQADDSATENDSDEPDDANELIGTEQEGGYIDQMAGSAEDEALDQADFLSQAGDELDNLSMSGFEDAADDDYDEDLDSDEDLDDEFDPSHQQPDFDEQAFDQDNPEPESIDSDPAYDELDYDGLDNNELDYDELDYNELEIAPDALENDAEDEFLLAEAALDQLTGDDEIKKPQASDHQSMESGLLELDEKTEPAMSEAQIPDLELQEPIDTDELNDQDMELLADNLTSQIDDADTEPDPLEEYEQIVEQKPRSLLYLTLGLALVSLLTLASLKFWDNRQQLAFDDTWGGFTQSVCGLLDCDIQPRRDLANIRLRQKMVGPVEGKDNRLEVKMLMVNQARFEQPYPAIVIKFTNSMGKQVTEKRFTVADYFPKKQNQLMPVDVEVHLAFETELPHPDALGFEFRFE